MPTCGMCPNPPVWEWAADLENPDGYVGKDPDVLDLDEDEDGLALTRLLACDEHREAVGATLGQPFPYLGEHDG